MIHRVTLAVDIHTLDSALPATLLGAAALIPGTAARVPGGMLVFQAALLDDVPGEASVYRFSLQSGSANAVTIFGTWLWSQLRGRAAALSVDGQLVPLEHGSIVAALRRAA